MTRGSLVLETKIPQKALNYLVLNITVVLDITTIKLRELSKFLSTMLVIVRIKKFTNIFMLRHRVELPQTNFEIL